MSDLDSTFPSIWHLQAKAKRRMPFFAWEYLDSGTGMERLVDHNRAALDRIFMTPRFLAGRFTPDVSTRLLGEDYSVPFGVAPVGMSGLMWPGAELILARAAEANRFPYTLSLVGNETPEAVAEAAPSMAWFQFYPPNEDKILKDLFKRVHDAGIGTIIFTIDVPIGSRRERQLVAGLSVPPKINAQTLFRIAKRPEWALATLVYGQPRFRTLESYFPTTSVRKGTPIVGSVLNGRPDWGYVDKIRDIWPGKLIVKGILAPEDAEAAITHGADAIVVSNHGGRQFDAAPASIDALPAVASQVSGRVPVLFDSGLRGGLDIIRALSLGADFCLLGRAFLFAVGALGTRGGDHAYKILREDLENNMIQLGARSLAELRGMSD